MSPLSSQPVLIAGLSTNIYNLPQATSSPLPVIVLIATHGRGSDQTTLAPLVEGIYARFEELEKEVGRGRRGELVVVTLVSKIPELRPLSGSFISVCHKT